MKHWARHYPRRWVRRRRQDTKLQLSKSQVHTTRETSPSSVLAISGLCWRRQPRKFSFVVMYASSDGHTRFSKHGARGLVKSQGKNAQVDRHVANIQLLSGDHCMDMERANWSKDSSEHLCCFNGI